MTFYGSLPVPGAGAGKRNLNDNAPYGPENQDFHTAVTFTNESG